MKYSFSFFLRGKTRHPALRRKSTGFRGISTNHLDEIKMPPERGERRFVLQERYGRRRNSKDEITLRGIRESVVRTRQLGPNRDSPGRARELTRKFQIELAKLEGRPFNEMRSSTAMPKPYLRSPFSLFFYPTILLHLFISFISLDISYFSHFFFSFPSFSELTLSIFSSRLEIFYLYHLCVYASILSRVIRRFDPIVTR